MDFKKCTADPVSHTKLAHPILLVNIDPKRCKPWPYHNRDKGWLTKTHCADLINTLKRDGQLEHILVRKLAGDHPDADYEIIYGVRRAFVCAEILHQPVVAHITDLDDKTCMILMHAENASSKDISEFERAYSFAQQMKSGCFKNQTEMAEIMGLSQGSISKMIRAAEILEVEWIAALFQNKIDIPVKPAYMLSLLLQTNETRENMKNEAYSIQEAIEKNGPLPASKILHRLIAAAKGKMNASLASSILSVNNKPVVCYRPEKSGKFTIVIEPEAMQFNIKAVEAACVRVFREHIAHELFPGNNFDASERLMADEISD